MAGRLVEEHPHVLVIEGVIDEAAVAPRSDQPVFVFMILFIRLCRFVISVFRFFCCEIVFVF